MWKDFSPSRKPEVFVFDLSLEGTEAFPSPDLLFSAPAFEIKELIDAKDRLNTTRSKLDHLDLKRWSGHTNFTSLPGNVVRELRYSVNPELCTIAWCKMFEMLEDFRLVDSAPQTRLRSFHLCEAPGGFICALNHYLQTSSRGAVDWDWRAISLNPYHEENDVGAMIDDDGFIRESLPHWYFGVDNTGNVLRQANIRGCWTEAGRLGAPLLVTADGSIDSQSDPNEQERITASLHYAEAVAALGMLDKGGSLVLKMFTLFEDCTLGLLYILGLAFQRVQVVKPLCSKWGNGETYIVCRGFRGVPQPFLEALLLNVNPVHADNVAVLPRDVLPAPFLRKVCRAAIELSSHQREVIENNLRLFAYPSIPYQIRQKIEGDKRTIAQNFARWFRISRLTPERRIVKGAHLTGEHRTLMGSRLQGRERQSGTLSTRQADAIARKRNREGEAAPLTPEHNAQATGKRLHLDEAAQEAGPAAAAAYNEPVRRMMARMGYVEGSGLGASGQGMTEPMQPAQRADRAGLGIVEEQVQRKAARQRAAEDLSSAVLHMLPEVTRQQLLPLTEQECGQWQPVLAEPVREVHMSRFIADRELFDLRQSRLQLTGMSAPAGASSLFVSVPPEAAQLGCTEEGWAAFCSLDSRVGLLRELMHKWNPADGVIIVLDAVGGGAADYIAREYNPTSAAMQVLRAPLPLPGFQFKAPPADGVTESTVERPVQEGPVSPTVAMAATGFEFNEGASEQKQAFISVLLGAIRLLREDSASVLIVRMGDTFTRFSAGVIYLLARTFFNVALCKPQGSSPLRAERFVLCSGVDTTAKHMLTSVLERVYSAQCQAGDRDVLEIVPMPLLTHAAFVGWLSDFNSVVAAREMHATREMLKQ